MVITYRGRCYEVKDEAELMLFILWLSKEAA